MEQHASSPNRYHTENNIPAHQVPLSPADLLTYPRSQKDEWKQEDSEQCGAVPERKLLFVMGVDKGIVVVSFFSRVVAGNKTGQEELKLG
jgi:hypothetical protein